MRDILRGAALVAFVLGAVAWAGPAEESLLQNGGFEQGIAGWRVLDMSGQSAFEPDSKTTKSGKQSLRIEKRGPGKPDWLKQSASLPAGAKEVHATCWFKVDKGARADVTVYFFDAKDAMLRDNVLVGSGPSKKWEKADERFEVPEGATNVGVNVKVTAKGVFWIDDLEVSIAGGAAEGLGNGGFEDGLVGWRPLEFGTDGVDTAADRTVKAAGKASARVARTTDRLFVEDGLVAQVRTPTDPGKQRLSVKARVHHAAHAAVALQAFDEHGVCRATARAPVVASGDAFVPTEVVLDAPAGTRRIDVSLIMTGEGAAWFDDVVLEKGR